MKEVEILIVGGGVAGTTVAEAYRAGGGVGDVAIVSDETHPLYSRVLLPHAAKKKIAPEKAFLKKTEWYAEKGIELLSGRSVARVDYKRRIATLAEGEEIAWKKLVIAVGGRPRAWHVPGAELPGVLRLQTYEDALALREKLTPSSRLAIVGSGFIALEFAAAAFEAGASATLFNRGPHFWTSVLGETLGRAALSALEAKGVEVVNSAKVEAVEGNGAVSGIRLSNGRVHACDLVGVGIGIETPMDPFGDLRGEHGLRANARLEASHTDVWIAGDCAEYEDELVGLTHVVGNWAHAVAQGRHVGLSLLGRREPFATLTSYSSNVVPGLNLIFLGDTKMRPDLRRVERVLEPGKKAIEFHMLGDRVVGAALLNAPDQRAAAAALIMAGPGAVRDDAKLSDLSIPLDAFR